MNYDYSPDEEEDLKYRYLCSHDLDAAQYLVNTIRGNTTPEDKDKAIRYYLLQLLVVTYFKPFTVSQGRKLSVAEAKKLANSKKTGRKGDEYRKHRIASKDFVPPAFVELHQKLEEFRNKQFAHSDLNHYNIRIANFGTAQEPWWIYGLKGQNLEFLDAQFERIAELVSVVQKKLDAELHAEEEVLKGRVIIEPEAEPPPESTA